ncbi:MAG: helix-turn-helix transcriptional regulator [Dehalococcoides mccartyi]|jgi:Predicted transcriptional regulators|uniref:helix-turn-helix domain-containing protein n=1 Tax=Dehalococcoides TaxID=61434 RepID=UPI00273801C6|nr:helix-turn-helix transcriptional regulator [Dehalococcoides mccartyi]MDP4279706.1 helix-turn-helix transcriptional regulator [Dehalococcoides mccartyi]
MMTEKTIEQRFGERIRDLRKKAGVSQEELADRAGVHRTYLGGIERGERNPSLKNIDAIARALKVSLSDLFKG